MNAAPWTWPERHSASDDEVVVRPEDVTAIRALAVHWDGAEHGAAGLCAWDEELEMYLETDEDGDPGPALSVFVDCAAMPDGFAGPVRNPYAGTPADEDEVMALTDFPDAGVREAIRSRQDIILTPEADELAAWEGANVTARGIDPKRPFETGDAARDLARILDAPLKEARARLPRIESRLAYYLLAFVQRAELAPGPYHRGEFGCWEAGRASTGTDGPLPEAEWRDRIDDALFESNKRYVEIAKAIDTLACDGRIKGSYAEVAARYALHDTYDSRTYEANLAELALAAARAFPEPDEATGALFSLAAARACNAGGRHEEASSILTESGLWPREAKGDEADALANWHDVICAEGWIGAIGTGAKTMREANAALRGTFYDEAWAYLYDDLDFDTMEPGLGRHLRAVCVQLRVTDYLTDRDED